MFVKMTWECPTGQELMGKIRDPTPLRSGYTYLSPVIDQIRALLGSGTTADVRAGDTQALEKMRLPLSVGGTDSGAMMQTLKPASVS